MRRTMTRWFAPALIVAGCLGIHGRASACTYFVEFVLTDRVALDGVIVVTYRCDADPDCDSVTVEVREGFSRDTLPGSVERLRGEAKIFLVWTPEAQLADGETYRVALVSSAGVLINQGQVVADARTLADEWPSIDDVPFLLGSERVPTGDVFCCGSDASCGPVCYTEYEILHATVDPDLSDLEGIPTFLYRLRATEADGSVDDPGWDTAERLRAARFAQVADEFCATLEVRNLLDGTMMQTTVCKDADTLVDVSTMVPTAPSLTVFGSVGCFSPPQGATETPDNLVDAWCEGMETTCHATSSCNEEWEMYCRVGVEASIGVDEPDAGEDAPPAAMIGSAKGPSSRHAKWCAVGRPGAPTSSSPWLMVGLAALLGAGWRHRRM